MRAPVGRPAVVRFIVEDDAGELVAASGPVTVTVYDGAGNVVATDTAQVESPGVYKSSFTPPETLDVLRAVAVAPTANGPVQLVEQIRVVGERVFPLSALSPDVDADARATLEELAADQAEEILGYSPVLVGKRVQWRLREPRRRIAMPQLFPLSEVYSLEFEGVPVEGTLVRSNGIELEDGGEFAAGWYSAHVAVGLERCPQDLRKAVEQLARYRFRDFGKTWDPRTTRVMTEQSEVYLARQSSDRPTGYPDVDYVLVAYRTGDSVAIATGTY